MLLTKYTNILLCKQNQYWEISVVFVKTPVAYGYYFIVEKAFYNCYIIKKMSIKNTPCKEKQL